MDQDKKDPITSNFSGSLEQPETVIEPVSQKNPVAAAVSTPSAPAQPVVIQETGKTPTQKKTTGGRFFKKINIFLILFILLIIGTAVAVYLSYKWSKTKSTATTTLATQNLTADELKKLSSSSVQVGDSKQELTIASNTTFNGKVLVRSDLDIAGSLKIGGNVSLPSLTVAGKSNFDSLQISKDLAVAGNQAVQGNISSQGSITIAGSASVGGTLSAATLNVDKLTLLGDFSLSRHLTTNGSAPSVSAGGSIGGGGTVSIGGTDTAGTVTINTGSSPAAGTLATITFAQSFGSKAPHVVITPIGSQAASIGYYITRSATGFVISCATPPSGGVTFSFDYIVIN